MTYACSLAEPKHLTACRSWLALQKDRPIIGVQMPIPVWFSELLYGKPASTSNQAEKSFVSRFWILEI
jgi:hypothetical protein